MKIAKSVKKNTTKKTTTGNKETKIPSRSVDPLYVIFEQHLFNFGDADADRKTFIGEVVAEYISYLRKNNIIVPKSLEQPIADELGTQVQTMLVRKLYGVAPSEFSGATSFSGMRGGTKKRAKPRPAKVG